MASGTIPKSMIDARTSVLHSASTKATHTINIPSSSAHFIILYGGALSTYAVIWTAATSGGIVEVQSISKGPDVTAGTGTNTCTITYPSARQIDLIDFYVFGSPCTLS